MQSVHREIAALGHGLVEGCEQQCSTSGCAHHDSTSPRWTSSRRAQLERQLIEQRGREVRAECLYDEVRARFRCGAEEGRGQEIPLPSAGQARSDHLM